MNIPSESVLSPFLLRTSNNRIGSLELLAISSASSPFWRADCLFRDLRDLNSSNSSRNAVVVFERYGIFFQMSGRNSEFQIERNLGS